MAVVAFDGVVLGDLATPLEVFSLARNAEGRPCYEVRTCSQQPQIESGHLTLQVPWRLSSLKRADTVIVPGIDNSTGPFQRNSFARCEPRSAVVLVSLQFVPGLSFLRGPARLTDSRRRRIGSRLRNWPGVIRQSKLTQTCCTSTTETY